MRNIVLRDFFNDVKPLTAIDEVFKFHQWEKEGNNYFLELDIPGVKKEDIKLNLEKNILSIEAQRKLKTGNSQKSFKYHSSYSVPEDIDTESVEAEYSDGVLILKAKILESKSLKQITVK